MDNALTPNKIKRLIHIAEDNSYLLQQMTPMNDRAMRGMYNSNTQGTNYESSSGLLDLDNVDALEAIGESETGSDCLNVPTTFCPAEMTGRSTGMDDVVNKTISLGRHTQVINDLQSEMDKQSHEVNNLIRYSICNSTACSFQSKRDLTADEASLMMREAPLPALPSQAQFTDTTMNTNSSVVSVGAYFQRRCSGLEAVLGKVADSPDRSGYSMPSITEVTPQVKYPIDETLDSVPVRQTRVETQEKPHTNTKTQLPNQNLTKTQVPTQNSTKTQVPTQNSTKTQVPTQNSTKTQVPTQNSTKTQLPNQNPTKTNQSTYKPAKEQLHSKNTDVYNKEGLDYSSISKAPESFVAPLNPLASSSFASTRQPVLKATSQFIRTMNAGLRMTAEDTEDSACPADNSISLSKIADFLGKESNISVTAMLKYSNRNNPVKKQPLTERQMNLQEDNSKESNETKVTSLRDSRKTDTASSACTATTVISLDKLSLQEKPVKVPSILVSEQPTREVEHNQTTRSKSPSSKSHSSLNTVQENYNSFKSGDSPLHNTKGEAYKGPVLSPNVVYRELEKSVDWQEVLQQKRNIRQSLGQDENLASLSGPSSQPIQSHRRIEPAVCKGTAVLDVKVPGKKLHVTKEPTNVTLCNTGTVAGAWVVKISTTTDSFPFKVGPTKFEIPPDGAKIFTLFYTGAGTELTTATIVFEEIHTGHKTALEITGGSDTKSFPIRTNHGVLSFVRPGRKEISLKNSTNKKVHIRVYIEGEGFTLDIPGMKSKGVYCMPFAPNECRSIPVSFNPVSNMPQSANLHLVYDRNSEVSRTVRICGCLSGDSLRWSGLVTYGDTALVRAISRTPISLELYNKGAMPAFLHAKVHFNLQYNAVAATARVQGGNCIVGGRARHSVVLTVDWARVERRARDAATSALATVSVLTGAEITRRRILKIIRDPSSGVPDTSLLDDRLKVLAGPFDGEDPSIDNMLTDFKETKASLNELIGGLQELTAQIVLPQDYADDNTIIIADDTIVEHHTLCE